MHYDNEWVVQGRLMYFIFESSLGNQNSQAYGLHPNLMHPHRQGLCAALEVT